MSTVSPTAEKVREEIRERLAELIECEPEEITDTASFIEDLEIDSLLAIELMVALDKEYEIEIPEEDFREIKNLDDTVKLVMSRIDSQDS